MHGIVPYISYKKISRSIYRNASDGVEIRGNA